ncbi:hypothetical protein PoB_004274300 [Plakobranchus ocellatus]|uniref:Uncharacterized protein n=1 Tax=Plakobranchus ocellatus TaxID=259542 RepID=A0AAV4B9I8_9GAST|nr:hypothetical protein PoB_004274300 [Plakobranchus ocellatus]
MFGNAIIFFTNSAHYVGYDTDTVLYPTTSKPDNLRNKTGLVVRTATVSRIMRGHVTATPFALSNRATEVRPGCNTQRIAPTLWHTMKVASDFVCSPTNNIKVSPI